MSDTVIEVEGLGKQFYRGKPPTIIDRLRGQGSRDRFWALSDVSFSVERGEIIGIIGRNGAGKSTLLKILSRITPPTKGEAKITGRLGSLLEVGTGFHPDLTGRENVFLNGSILGLTRAYIRSVFDEIVDFAEVEEFIDTPVKHYSSGMYMRLAFAVASYMQPEVLIVDEVLAVGDAAFQKKCLDRINVRHRDQTVLIVSHNMHVVRQLCSRGILLQDGRVTADGNVDDVLKEYAGLSGDDQASVRSLYDIDESARIQITEARLVEPDRLPVQISDPMVIELDIVTRRPLAGAYVCLGLRNQLDQLVYWTADFGSERYESPAVGTVTLRCELPSWLLVPGRYSISPNVVAPGREAIFAGGSSPLVIEVVDHETPMSQHGLPWPGTTAARSAWQCRNVLEAVPDA